MDNEEERATRERNAAADLQLQTVSLLLIATIASGFALYWLRPVLIPLLLAAFVYLTLTPLLDFLVLRWRWPRTVASAATLLPAVGGLLLSGAIVAVAVRRVGRKADTYQSNLWALLEKLSVDFPWIGQVLAQGDVRERLSRLPVTDLLLGVTNALLEVVSNLVLVLVLLLFLLVRHEPRPAPAGGLSGVIGSRVRGYLVVKVAVSIVTAAFVTTILAACAVDLWLVFGLLVFVLNFIPSIGSIIATLLPLPMVLVEPDVTATRVLLVIGLPGVLQFTIGNLIEPKIFGDSLDLHPVALLAALIFWGSLWGIVGMLIAAPITAVLRMTLDEYERTRPLARALAGR